MKDLFENIPLLSDIQLKVVAHNITKFLSLIYPNLLESKYQSYGGEIRSIKRDESLSFVRSLNFWRLDEEFQKYLFNLLKDNINGKPYCLYYSCYNFDTSESNKITKKNAKCTSILPMDFDTSEDDFLKAKKVLTDLGIETIDIFTGHGFQSIILLSETVFDDSLIGRWTKLLVKKGFPVDSTLVDSARMLRLPYTYNCKSYDVKNKKYDKGKSAIPTLDVNWTEKRYNVTELFKIIENYNENEEQELIDDFFESFGLEPSPSIVPEKIQQYDYEKNIDTQDLLIRFYKIPNLINQPKALHKILTYTPNGVRNSTLLFLIPYFKNTLGMNKDNIIETISIWASQAYSTTENFNSKSEVNRLLNYDFKKKSGLYTKEMFNIFGKFEFASLQLSNKIKVTNTVDFASIGDCSFKIYLSLLLDNMIKTNKDTVKGSKKYSIDEMCKLCKISRRTFFNNIKDLTNTGLVIKTVRDTAKRKGDSYYYYVNPYFSYSSGFISIEKATVRVMLDYLTDGEMKLYTYMRKMINNNENVFGSQQYLAKMIGKSGHSSISKMIDSLESKGFIEKCTTVKNGIKHCSYSLLM